MKTCYSAERNTQMLIALLKAHGIKKIIVSPGATNICFVASIQCDPFFEIFSSVDERSAAYMACGMAAESSEPVALSCTGATASRNYLPGLTEAYYRKLPVLAITATQHIGRVGQLIPQVIDRSVSMRDITMMSVQIPKIHDKEDEWAYEVMLNKALLELRHRGQGPVHVNLATEYSSDFSVKELPKVRVINRICPGDDMPKLNNGRVAIYVGAHNKWSNELSEMVDTFCSIYDGVVLCDHTSNYRGKYRILPNLLCSQVFYSSPCRTFDILIHIGEVSGAYTSIFPEQVWRVSADGEVRDAFRKLRYVFEMQEEDFFKSYLRLPPNKTHENSFIQQWKAECDRVISKVPEVPFSNVWIAQQTISRLPEGSVLHLGILNTLRAWNFFESPNSVLGYSNTGGFGIDGCVSSLIGASLVDGDRPYFGVVGDLAFFYDMNVIGNRHVGSNVRLILINNGRGTEFLIYNAKGAIFGEDTNAYIAAAGHFGNKSQKLVKHYTEDLGFEYFSASTKEEYLRNVDRFTSPQIAKPMLFEVFTNSADESKALEMLHNIEKNAAGKTKKLAKKVLGDRGVEALKKMLDK
ncbi:hypothetical protein LJC40_01380 [Synergistaceae bacterium OttesenSCG-928-D05]|nr:hypothetical protein [Synergistaceae bacterium OttesenSCG-928-D05]